MSGGAALVLAALLSHWRRRPLQLAMLLIGVVLATALWVGVQAINAEARASYARANAALGAGGLARIVPAPGRVLTTADYVALRRAGWLVSPEAEGHLRLAGGGSVRVIGIEPLTRTGLLPGPCPGAVGAQAGGAGAGGAGAGGEVVDMAAGEDLLAFITPPGVGYGDRATLALLGKAADWPGEIALREDPDAPPASVIVDIGIAQGLLGLGDRLSGLVAAPVQPAGLSPLDAVVPGLQRIAPSGDSDPAALTASFHLNLTAFALLAFAVGLFITRSATGLAFEQRRPLVRTLRAIGVPRAQIVAVMGAELALLALLAGGGGVLVGWLLAGRLMPGVAATLSGLYGADVAGVLHLRAGWVLSGLAMALAGTALAGAQGLVAMARMPLLAAGQTLPWVSAARRALRLRAGFAAGLLVALPVCLAVGGVVAGLAALGCLLLAAALLLPLLLDALLGWGASRARGVLAGWFLADTRAQLGGLSLALMALFLALAANIGVGTMVSSFRGTFTGWLDQRLAATLYVSAPVGEAGAVGTWLEGHTEAVLPDLRVRLPLAGRPGQIRAIATDEAARAGWPLLRAAPGAWESLAAGRGVFVNEQLWRQGGTGLGATLALPGGALPVVAVYSDYGNPGPQAALGLAAFRARFPDVAPTGFALRAPPEQVPALRRALDHRFALPEGAITDQAQVKAAALRIFERTFAVTAALNLLTLLVAGVALLTGLLTLASMRLAQLAPVWAAGVTRRRLAVAEMARTLLLAAMVTACAVPLGLGLAWLLLAVVNVAAFGWRLPMQVSTAPILQAVLAALLTALVAGAWPAWRLARLSPGRLLRVFADER